MIDAKKVEELRKMIPTLEPKKFYEGKSGYVIVSMTELLDTIEAALKVVEAAKDYLANTNARIKLKEALAPFEKSDE